MEPRDNSLEALASQRGSRATSPGGCWREMRNTRVVEVSGQNENQEQEDAEQISNGEQRGAVKPSRYRPRTFPYQRYLPYRHPDRSIENLSEITRNLYIAVSAGDFVPGATHWTRELRGWIQLKFNMPREERANLTKLYYELSLAPGMDRSAAERFSSMFMTLTKRKHYLKPGEDLYLDWRPLFKEFKRMTIPSDGTPVVTSQSHHTQIPSKTLVKIAAFAQHFFDPREVPAVLEEVLPFFSLSSPENAFAVIGMINLLLPTSPAPKDIKWQPQYYLPSIFHMWSLMNRSKVFDIHILDLTSRLARDCLLHESVDFTPYGMFTKDQASLIITAALKLLEIPVGQVTSPYSSAVDGYLGLAALLVRDPRKQPIAHHAARWIVMSLSPESATASDSMLTYLEGLIQAIETFYHPSNSGHWTRNLSQLVYHLADFFLMRWNRERSGEMPVPKERHLNEQIKRRFVLCLRDVTFLGIFAKSGTAITYSLSTLQALAILEPDLVLPGALQRIYPAMRGTVEVHRTTSSIRALFELTRVIAKTKGFRCHLTSLLGLALPGIDANDLDKSMHTLTFMQAVFYEMPMWELADSKEDGSRLDGMLAAEWVTGQIERLENEGVDVEIDYAKELSDEDELAVLRSSTADFRTFLNSFLDSVFNLLRNLPDASRVKDGSPEEAVTNALPATFSPMVSSMSPELYGLVLDKLCDFVAKNTVFQARDAMAYLCCSLCKVDPHKALSKLLPILTQNIRTEIEENGAGSSRVVGSDVLPRDKALVYNISLLSMSLVHVGSALVEFADEIRSIARFMHEKCKGVVSTHASNVLHHVFLTLSMTYTVDQSLFEESDVEGGITAMHWARRPDPQRLSIKWHYADENEINYAVAMFKEFADREISRLRALMSDNSPVRRDGSGRDWSDEVSQGLILFRLMLSGVAPLFDPRHDIGVAPETIPAADDKRIDDDEAMLDIEDNTIDEADFGATEDEDVKPTFQYPTGYYLRPGDENYKTVHAVRDSIGHVLHEVHCFLQAHQQDDVSTFNSLYSAYKSWFVDVGFERSAHVLDRVTRLLAADIGAFRSSGLRKEYPRPLLVRRAYVYHLQRLRHNASPRHKTDLDLKLLKDLVESCVSSYTETRRVAQTAIESTLKVLVGARPVVVPPLLDHFERAIRDNDFPRIKGSMYTLLFGSLAKPVGRDWRYTPRLIKAFLDVIDVDKVSVQKIATAATIQAMDMTRMFGRLVVLDHDVVANLHPSNTDNPPIERRIARRRKVIQRRFDFVKSKRLDLAEELAEVAKASHWRKESRTASLAIGLGMSVEGIASDRMIDLIVNKAVNPHPSLRAIYQSALVGLFAYVDIRAVADHKYENYLTDKSKLPGMVKTAPARDDPQWTSKFLDQFKSADAELYFDHDYPGWLFWGKDMPSYQATAAATLEYDDAELRVRERIGSHVNREWLSKVFGYLKQEPRDTSADRFRLTDVVGLVHIFHLIINGAASATFEDVKELAIETFGKGTDKHEHRATSEIMAALLNSAVPLSVQQRTMIWEFAFPIVRDIFEDGITPENMTYWQTFLGVVVQNKDPRRSWPLVEWLANFRLDMKSSAAFKEGSKITMLQHGIIGIGWHFRLDDPARKDFLQHLDHPYKTVRDVMGQTLACMHRIHYHESHKDLNAFADKEAAASSIGSKTFVADKSFEELIHKIFSQLEQWRLERPAGQQTASPYTMGSKTVLSWLETSLQSFECTQLAPFFADDILQALLHMMDIKEDTELQASAYSVFRHLGNIPYAAGEEKGFVEACIGIGRTASSWHQRLRIMINMQAVYFRNLFLMPAQRQHDLFNAVTEMLEDSQLEVRVGAGTTLSGMIRCSPVHLRDALIPGLIERFTTMLRDNPLPRAGAGKASGGEHSKANQTRHAAVLGLGALVQAFPYTSPPPQWMPGVLTTLATKAASNPGMVGQSAKAIVSDFKKTRQDTWHLDVKVFAAEQLEDLEGVLWKSYFA